MQGATAPGSDALRANRQLELPILPLGSVALARNLREFRLAINCTIEYSTVVLPFRVTLQPGLSLHEQVTFAAKRALVSGRLKPGDPFPSVRALSKALKINPNTAHKIITQLIEEGLLDVRAASGTTVAALPASTRAERRRLVRTEVEQLVVEAKKLGLALDELQEAIAHHWQKLTPAQPREA